MEETRTTRVVRVTRIGSVRRPQGRSVRWMSWTAFFVVSIVLLVGSLSRMASIGPDGAPIGANLRTAGGAANLRFGSAPDVAAPAAYVFDAATGAVYYAKNADDERPMASTTKVMTILLAAEQGNLDRTVEVHDDAAQLVRDGSSAMGLSAGEKLTMRELLYGLILPSGNDAAVAIADAISGDVPTFVGKMNDRAKQLGLTRTHFVTPHGLDEDGHYTTARDLAVLTAYALKNADIVKIASALHYSIPKTDTHKAYELQTGNDLLAGARAPYPGAIGMKPGFTWGAMYCMSFASVRHGRTIVGAVLGDPSWQVRITDMHALLDWGFQQEGVAAARPAPAWSFPDPNE